MTGQILTNQAARLWHSEYLHAYGGRGKFGIIAFCDSLPAIRAARLVAPDERQRHGLWMTSSNEQEVPSTF